ncbi:MAG: hypothetical protein ABS909_10610 [Arthrobacter sp.]
MRPRAEGCSCGQCHGQGRRRIIQPPGQRRSGVAGQENDGGVLRKLRRQVLAEAAKIREDPRYPALLDALRDQAYRLLGPDAQVQEAPGGGITASRGSRSVDLSLPALGSAAMEAYAGEVRALWQE